MRLPLLDERLSLAVSLFPACAYGADIGADHGRLSCLLLAKGICERMCVADISAPSLKKAERLLTLHGLSDRADFAVGDGLSVLNRRAQAVAILGMGGRTLSDILRSGAEYLHGAALIVSAHTEIELLRQTLSTLHYGIETERIALAGGRFYPVMRARPGEESYTEKQLFLGPRLMETNVSHYADYVFRRLQAEKCRRSPEAARHTAWLEEEWHRVGNCADD